MYTKLINKYLNAPNFDRITTKEGEATFKWRRKTILKKIPSTQVYGFCLTNKNQIVIVKDFGEKHYSLPGGEINKDEIPEKALVREFQEEAQFTPTNIKLLGALVIKEWKEGILINAEQHVRYVCGIDKIDPFIPGKDGWEIEERLFVNVKDLPRYINWIKYPTGQAIFLDFLRYLTNEVELPCG